MTLLHRLLLRLAPETAHHVVIRLLRLLQWFRFGMLRRRPHALPAIHVVPDSTLRFPGRLGLAAGFDKNAEVYSALASLGFSFVEVGTVTPRAQEGNPKPRIFRHGGNALVNHLGFNNCGLDQFRLNLQAYRSSIAVPLLANIGKNKDTPNESAHADYARGFERLGDLADGFVVNLSSPNTPGLRALQSAEFLTGIARLVPAGKPTWVKLAPDLPDDELAALCEQVAREDRFAGVVLTNTSRGLAQALVGAEQGGLSGAPLIERALHCVRVARPLLGDKTLIGVGGIMSGLAAVRMREAGADLVEIYTGFIYGGPPLVREIRHALGEDKDTRK